MHRTTIRLSNSWLLTKTAGMIAAAIVIVSGVTFAALQSQQDTLKGNTIQTAVANLQLSADGTSYSNSLPGYAFTSLVPGGQPMPNNGYPIYLKNAGTTPLALNLSAASTVANPDNADLSGVHIILTPSGGGTPQNITLQTLIDAGSTGGVALTQASHVMPSQTTVFTIQVALDSNAVNGPSATIGNLDLNFGASAVN